MSSFKLSTNATTAIVIVAGLVYLGFTFNRDPASGAAQLIPVLGAVAGAIKLLRQGDVVEAKADTAAAQSQDNGAQLAAIAPQVVQAVSAVADNTALTQETHGLVNGQTNAYKDLIERFAAMEVRVAKAESLAEGITEGRRQQAGMAPLQTAEPQADGTILVEAPAVIQVVAPGDAG